MFYCTYIKEAIGAKLQHNTVNTSTLLHCQHFCNEVECKGQTID